jgi:TRAP-type C4-dicarboxylate transport system substrate-binding protein
MRKLRKINILCGTLLYIFLQMSSAQGEELWKIGHVRPAGSAVDLDVHKFIESIAKNSQEKIHFEVYAANKLGDYSVVQERVSLGEVEMYVGPFGTTVDRRVSLAFTPFLVDSWENARKTYSSSSPLLKNMESYLKEQNIKILGGYPVYFGGIALTERPDSPGNPDVKKKMIIRVPPMRSFEMTARELGYTPYPITWMYARMGLQTGMVKGIIGGGAEGYKGLPAIRYFLPIKDHFEYWFIYMNLDRWKTLSPQTQQAISKAAEQMEADRYLDAEQDEKESIAELRRRGIEVIEIQKAEYETMRQKIEQTVWPVMRQDIGPAFDDVIRFSKSDQ